MTTFPDPLQTLPLPADRVFYAAGILLDADDFRAEQLYHRSRLARTLAYLHGSGTVAGLWIYRTPPLQPGDDPRFPEGREERLEVEPGLAIDRLGRLIEVPRPACIRLNRWFDAQTDDDLVQGFHGAPFNGVVVDLFLRFVACEREKTPAFAAGPFDALDAVQPARLRDGYELNLVIRQEAEPPLPRPVPDLTLPPDPGTPPENERQRRDAIARAIADSDQQRRTLLQNTVFNAWREGTDQRDASGNLTPLPEHATNQDTTEVFLARIVLPATVADGGRPVRSEAEVAIDNYSRPFVYSTAALARWAGI